MAATDIIVIGGGIIGCSTALACIEAGASVLLLERDTLGAHASSAAAGMLAPIAESIALEAAPAGCDDERLLHLGVPALHRLTARMPELAERSGIDPKLRSVGIVIPGTEAQAAGLVAAQGRLARYGVELLDRETLHARAPGLEAGFELALLSPLEGAVDAALLTRAFARAAARSGAHLREGVYVREVLWDRDRAIGVRTADQTLYAAEIVWCTGAWAGAGCGMTLPVEPVKGQLVSVEPAAAPDAIVWGDGVYVVPPGDGSVKIGATVERAGFDVRPTAGGVATLTEAASRLLPGLRRARFLATWAGLRPATPDGLPLVGRYPGRRGFTVAVGHHRNGILLSELSAQLVAGVLAGAKADPLQAYVDPARPMATNGQDRSDVDVATST
jgi:glycine oxidase